MADNHPNRPSPEQSQLGRQAATATFPPRKGAADVDSATASRHVAADDQSMTRSNIALMNRVKAGDESALAELYDLYSGSVYAIARHILRHAADAEEVVIDTFWEIWRKADRYDPSRGSVPSYIMLLARSRAIDRSRQARSHENTTERYRDLHNNSDTSVHSDADEPEADLVLAERRAHIRALLADLPPERREPIELNFFHGLSHAQVAEALDLPLGTIKTRIRQGLIQLYDQIRSTE
jgi:RNA polymerase sigma-70 factor, ECF subfamily